MTIIAWDGQHIAADRRACNGGMHYVTTKIRRLACGDVIAWTGTESSAHMVARWYEDGADPARWPECQKDKEDWSRLIAYRPNFGGLFTYEQQPVAVPVEAPFMAWGAGRDFALMAMRLGKTAAEAVLLTSDFEVSCGDGVDVEQLTGGRGLGGAVPVRDRGPGISAAAMIAAFVRPSRQQQET